MGYQPLEKLLPQSDNSMYKLVIMASKRAVEIAEGMPKLVEGVNSDRPATIALEEISNQKIWLKTAEESHEPKPEKETKKKKTKDKK
jgi:DNA-directed RNA polymerase subunit omega